MTDKEKLTKAVKLADAMYYAAQYLTTDASRLHKAMEEYHQFIIHEYFKEEPVNEDLEEVSRQYALNNTPYEDCTEEMQDAFKAGAQWQKEVLMKDILDGYVCFNDSAHNEELPDHCIITNEEPKESFEKRGLKLGDKVKVIIVKED